MDKYTLLCITYEKGKILRRFAQNRQLLIGNSLCKESDAVKREDALMKWLARN